jgi:hypothetical protein
MMDIMVHLANKTVINCDENINHNQEEYDDSEYEKKEENESKLYERMEFKT